MNLNIDQISELIAINQNRLKTYRWTELFSVSGSLPTTLKSLISLHNKKIDPFWSFTQSAKNYTPSFSNLLDLYSNTDVFKLESSNYGLTNRFLSSQTLPDEYSMIVNNSWYWKQKKIHKLSSFIKLIPGIQSLYVISSTSVGVATNNSDIDLVIRCNNYMSPVVRLWLKLFLKLFGIDVHSFYLEISVFIWKAFSFILNLSLMSKIKSKALNRAKKIIFIQLENKKKRIFNYKNRSGLKIDAGIFFHNKDDLKKFYSNDVRQVSWLWSGQEILSDLNNFINKDIVLHNSCYYVETFQYKKILYFAVTITLCALNLIAYPISILLLQFNSFKNFNNPNFSAKINLIAYIPRYYKEGNMILLDKM